MNENEQAEITAAPAAAIEEESSAPSQEKDPVQAELERVEKKPKRTRIETLEYNIERLKKEREAELKKAGITEDDDRPLTIREFKSLQQEQAQETAFKMADSIENESERKLVQYHLENTIKPSGNAETDLKNARLIVNAVKNGQIVEEQLRAVKPKAAGSAASAPPKEKQMTELTKEEKDLMVAFKLTEAQVLAARPKE